MNEPISVMGKNLALSLLVDVNPVEYNGNLVTNVPEENQFFYVEKAVRKSTEEGQAVDAMFRVSVQSQAASRSNKGDVVNVSHDQYIVENEIDPTFHAL